MMVVKSKAPKKAKEKKSEDADKLVDIEKIVKKLLSLMGTNAEPHLSEDKENDAVVVNIKTEDESGLLIGPRGETLNSLQTIIGMIYRQKTDKWQRIIVNISDWRERQEERLGALAHQAAQRAKETGEPQSLYNLNAAQRRIIHVALAKDKEVETESAGEGRERYLVVRLEDK